MTTSESRLGYQVVQTILAYDQIVRGNDSAAWNTIRAVHEDSDGQVAYEVEETAHDIGVLRTDAEGDDADRLRGALLGASEAYKVSLASDPRVLEPLERVQERL